MKYLVNIIESERGWGRTIDEVKEFDDIETARKFIRDYNKQNTAPTAPDWYMQAEAVNFSER